MKKFMGWIGILLCLVSVVIFSPAARADDAGWPAITREMKPWTYWWWPGSAVDTTNITHELERFAAAGYGGVHIVPIYGAKNADARYIEYLSDQWLAMLRHTIKEGERLGLGVDMTLGTGWCFGGPNIPREMSGMMLDSKTLAPKVVGPKVKRAAPGGEGFMLNPFYGDAMSHYLERFTDAFDKAGRAGPSAPGGGLSQPALPNAVYHDSYEYKSNFSPDLFAEFKKRRGYDLQPELKNLLNTTDSNRAAKVRCDYNETISDMMVENSMPKWIEWAHAHGMKTRYQAHGSPANWLDLYALADIPETEMFHTDRDVLISKFASSAAHVTGKKLVSAETGTWLDEHFTETLGDMKKLVDQLFLSGVNHVYYHGACYSPDDATWPGWLFYAATEMNSRNAFWRDVPALNAYIARCQSLLRAGEPDNDILLYWPIRDYWNHTKSLAPMMTVHNREWFYDEEIGKTAKWLWENGYAFDYVSDRQLTNATSRNGSIATSGGKYNAVICPFAKQDESITNVAAFNKLAELSLSHLVLFGGWTTNASWTETTFSVAQTGPIYDVIPPNGDSRRWALVDRFSYRAFGLPSPRTVTWSLGDERFARAESFTKEFGLNFIRRRMNGQPLYFIVNDSTNAFEGWLPLRAIAKSVRVLDPMSGRANFAETKSETNRTLVRLQLPVGASTFLLCSSEPANVISNHWKEPASKLPIIGNWKIEFIAGGPEVPAAYTTDKLASWTERGGAAESFAGTARYKLTFDAPAKWAKEWQLDLGEVHESARVKLNGRDLGTLILPPYRMVVDDVKSVDNVLEVEVTNLSANRVRDLDRRKVDWKVMKDINLVNIDYKPFDASKWPVRPSGLLGPVTLTPVAPAP